jgi:hypothetical protein
MLGGDFLFGCVWLEAEDDRSSMVLQIEWQKLPTP